MEHTQLRGFGLLLPSCGKWDRSWSPHGAGTAVWGRAGRASLAARLTPTSFPGFGGSGSQVDSARMNLASSFVNGFVNAAFGQDKLLTDDGNKWLYKNKDHGEGGGQAGAGGVPGLGAAALSLLGARRKRGLRGHRGALGHQPPWAGLMWAPLPGHRRDAECRSLAGHNPAVGRGRGAHADRQVPVLLGGLHQGGQHRSLHGLCAAGASPARGGLVRQLKS